MPRRDIRRVFSFSTLANPTGAQNSRTASVHPSSRRIQLQPPAKTRILGQGPQLYETAEISIRKGSASNMPPSRAQSSSRRPSRNPDARLSRNPDDTTTGQATTSFYQLFPASVDEADVTLPLTEDQQQQEAAALQQQEEDLFEARSAPDALERYKRISTNALWDNLNKRAFYEVVKGPASHSISALTQPPPGLAATGSYNRISLSEEGIQRFIRLHQGLPHGNDRRLAQEFLHQICARNMTRLALANSVKYTNSLLQELKEARAESAAKDKAIEQLRKQLPELRQTCARTKAATQEGGQRARSRSVAPGAFDGEPLLSDDEPARATTPLPPPSPSSSPSSPPSPSPPPRRRAKKRRSTREATTASQAPSTSGKRSARFPDPKMFSGSKEKDSVDFRTWKEDLDSKLLVNDDHFESETARVAYIMTRLEVDARQHASALAQVRGGISHLVQEELIDRLVEVFNDPNREIDAREKLRSLRMTHLQDARDFLSQFSHLATEGRLPVAMWKEELHFRVYDALRMHMLSAAEDPMISYQGYSAQLISRGREVVKSAQNYKARADRIEKAARFTSGLKPTPSPAVTPAQAAKLARSPTPAELPTRPRERTPATTKPSQNQDVHCYNCGEPGHIAPKCPKPKKAPAKEIKPQEATQSPEDDWKSEESSPDPDSEPEN